MNNIIKAAKMDLSLVRPYWWNTLFVMLFPVVFSIMNRSLVYGVSFTMCFIGMTTSYTFSISEKNGMERLYGILPVPKKHMVIGRYLYTCAVGTVALLFSLVVDSIVLYKWASVEITAEGVITSALTGIVMFTLYTVFSLPMYYKFGAIKGRYFMFIPVAGYLAILWVISNINVELDPVISGLLDNNIVFIAAVLSVCIIAFSLSVFASVRIVRNKEV
ncbi:MAG: ABC-2 transporter permease [Oscillospiraceae bacterium]|nr:ABC-2 transporter permease [Oscillospiraceae bacterium]